MFLTNRYNLNKTLLDDVNPDNNNRVIKLIKAINNEKDFSKNHTIYIDNNDIYSYKGKDYDFFLDIDETICQHSVKNPSEFDHDFILVIHDNNHAIYRGVKELLIFMLKIEGSRIIFYSAGKPKRNNILIPALIQKLGLEVFSDRILVYSDTLMTFPLDETYCPNYGLIRNGQGNKKKKISMLARDMNNSILIDDDRSYCLRGEELNFVSFSSDIEDYDNPTKNKNGIFRIAGLIYLALCQNDFTIVQFMQLIFANDSISNIKLYYDIGLSILQQFNQNLSFDNLIKTPVKNVEEIKSEPTVQPKFVPNPPDGMCHARISEKLISSWFPNKYTIIVANDKRYNNRKTLIFDPTQLTDIYYDPNIFQYDEETCGLKHIVYPEFLIYLKDTDFRFKISMTDDENSAVIQRRYIDIREILVREKIAISYIYEYYDYRYLDENDIKYYFFEGKANVSCRHDRELDAILVKLTNKSTVKISNETRNRLIVHKDNDTNWTVFSYYALWISYKNETGDFIQFTM